MFQLPCLVKCLQRRRGDASPLPDDVLWNSSRWTPFEGVSSRGRPYPPLCNEMNPSNHWL